MTLTAKQQAQVAKAPQAQKATLRAMYGRQSPQPPRKPVPRPQPKRTPVRKPLISAIPRSLGYAFDGFDKRHLPLDEVTAPYTTTNFISTMEFGSEIAKDQVIVVCPRMKHAQETYIGPMTDFIAVRYDANETIDSLIPYLSATRCPIIDVPTQTSVWQGASVRARLHNLSVKLECLGTNTGLYPPGSAYIGSVPTLETGPHSTGAEEALKIKLAWAEDSIHVGYLRSVSAASLIDKPVFLNAAIAENISYKTWYDMSVPPTATDIGSMSFSTALEPIVIYIPRVGAGDTVVNYRVVIGQQWCSRHPHNVMLRSTQKQHPVTTPNDWHKAVGAVKDVGEHLLQRAGGAAVDALASRMRQAFNPARGIADIPFID